MAFSNASLCNTSGETLWLFGLPSAGKTTVARKIAQECAGYVVLDGDDVRATVNNYDMGRDSRLLHLSYMAFCCKQLNDCGINVAAAFVTPLEQHRDRVRSILPNVRFVWLRCAATICASRDPKGLWKKATAGLLPEFTGAGGGWEDPTEYALRIDTGALSEDESLRQLRVHLGLIAKGDPSSKV